MGSTSAYKKIIDSIVTVLGSTSYGITTITHDYENIWDWQEFKFPAVTIVPQEKEINRFCFDSTGGQDREAVFDVKLLGYVYDRFGDTAEIRKKKDTLRANLEKALATSTAVRALTLDVIAVRSSEDENIIDNYGFVNCNYRITYLYNKMTP